jgi:alpha-amylase/alpha-mannosidase (GH57 family)
MCRLSEAEDVSLVSKYREETMKRIYPRLIVIAILLTILAGCGPQPAPTAVPTAIPPATPEATVPPAAEDVLYVAIIWHQHQPLYYKDPTTGLYAAPWVRLHAAKDYVDMAALVEQYPKIHVTFNLTPSLLRQVDDLASGAKDVYWAMTEVPADQLTAEQKIFVLQNFFRINQKIRTRFPRYQELFEARGSDQSDSGLQATAAQWTTDDFRDLQVLFNLAWTDPDWLAQDPLKALVEKGRGYSEEDKAVVLGEHLRLIQEVVPLHKRLQDAGQIEVTMTPYAHPILPLLVSTDLAKVARPDIELPKEKFYYKQDAVAQVQKGVQLYEDHFGQPPRGMWPAEGSVAQEIVSIVSDAGIQWMASDEGVLAYSLGLPGFTRDSKDTVQEADVLYRPYYVKEGDLPPVGMVFRDVVISDKVGFTYKDTPGEQAAQDFIDRLHAIKDQLKASGATGPHLASVILDGENAWEYYDNDGKEFLHNLYKKLSEDPQLVTVTPSEYLDRFPDQPTIEKLWAGSWINHDFTTWIGEEEENTAWTYLKRTRDVVQQYVLGKKTTDQATLDKAMDLMYAAEGSDWFWWYGSDQDSGDDPSFDRQFRSTLTDIFKTLNEPVPDWLYVPIIPAQPAPPSREMTGLLKPTIDGVAEAGEWAKAGAYTMTGDVPIQAFAYGFDARNIYLRLGSSKEWKTWPAGSAVGVYLSVPKAPNVNSFSRYGATADPRTILGFGAAFELSLTPDGQGNVTAALSAANGDNTWAASVAITTVASSGTVLEVAIPLDKLGEFEPGNVVNMRAVYSYNQQDGQIVPTSGGIKIVLPDLGRTTNVLVVTDPQGDDHGPGTYTYPQDGVFKPGNFDILTFTVGYDDKSIVFQFTMAGAVENVWGSGNGLSVQALDIYIDQDGASGGGARMLLPGRNAAVAEGDGWEYAIWAEGWTAGIYKAGAAGKPEQVDATFAIIADPAQKKVTIRVPKAVLGDTPEQWRYIAVVMGQDGVTGVNRIREVKAQSAQWAFGGAPADTNHTRIIDVAWSGTPAQEEFLSKYPASQEANMDSLKPDDFAIIPWMAVPK